MLAVMKLEGFGGHHRGERITGEGKFGQLEGHGKQLLTVGDLSPLG